jgi:hypothetical protein
MIKLNGGGGQQDEVSFSAYRWHRKCHPLHFRDIPEGYPERWKFGCETGPQSLECHHKA